MGRGTIEAETLRTEQFGFEARTSDPTDAQPGEYWIRTDQTSSNPDVIAELRRQNTSGVTAAPIFAGSEESNLGSDVVRGPSVVLDNGSVGFIAMTTDGGAVGSPRAVNAAGAEYLSHDKLELDTIPDTSNKAIYRWTLSEGGGTTAFDSIGSADGLINSATWVSGDYVGGNALQGDGVDDYVDVGTLPNFSSITGSNFAIAYTLNNFDGTGDFGINNGGGGEAVSIRHGDNGPSGAPELYLQDSSNGSTLIEYADSGPLGDGNKHRTVINKTGNSAGDIDFYVDGAELNSTNFSTGFSSTGSFSFGFGLLAENVDNSFASFETTMDDVIIFDDSLSNTEITEDYNGQPWS